MDGPSSRYDRPAAERYSDGPPTPAQRARSCRASPYIRLIAMPSVCSARAGRGARPGHAAATLLKAGLAGMAGLSLPGLLRGRAGRPRRGGRSAGSKSVILLWMAGGPSHIDTWDPKPDRPLENRGPFGVIPHQAARRARLRAPAEAGGDARQVHDHPLGGRPAQQPRAEQGLPDRPTCEAEPRHQPARPSMYPAIGSIVAKHHGPNHPAMPPYVAFMTLAVAPRLRRLPGQAVRPVHRQPGGQAADLHQRRRGHRPDHRGRLLPPARGPDARAASGDRRSLLADFDRLRARRSTAPGRSRRWTATASRRWRCWSAAGPRRRSTCRSEPAGGPRPLRQAPVVPAGAPGPAAGRGGRRVRHARPQLPHRLGHLGHARRQHPALRRHQQGPQAAAAAVRPPASRRWSATWTSAACSTTCWCIAMGEFGRTPHDGHAGQHRRPQPLAGA